MTSFMIQKGFTARVLQRQIQKGPAWRRRSFIAAWWALKDSLWFWVYTDTMPHRTLALYSIVVCCAALRCIALHFIVLHSITFHYIPLHSITFYYILLHTCIHTYIVTNMYIIFVHCIYIYIMRVWANTYMIVWNDVECWILMTTDCMLG